MNRRDLLRAGVMASAGIAMPWTDTTSLASNAPVPARKLVGKAKAMIMIYLPGGVTQQDTWDPKEFTPYRRGMKGSDLLATCPAIPTAADGIRIGQGLEQIAHVMDKAALIRSLNTTARFGASHVKAQFYSMTGYLEPVGLKPPSIGSVVARSLGPRDPNVPPYIYIGRDLVPPPHDVDKIKAQEFTGPGFYGSAFAPFRIEDPAGGLAELNVLAGMTRERLDRRIDYLHRVSELAGLDASPVASEYLKAVDDARNMMDSPVKAAFDYRNDEKPETIAAYEPPVTREQVQDKSYYFGDRFSHGLLLARRLVERGARYVQVEMQYGPFKGFDMHDFGGPRMIEMKRQIDRPIAQLIRDLEERGLLESTLVCIESEFGRTIQSAPAKNATGIAGSEPIGATETHDGTDVIIENEKMYGLHGHFSTNHTVVLFGGGIRGGTVYGKTADRHPMLPIENAVRLMDVQATFYSAMGIPPDHHYITEGRPFYVTKDAQGKPIQAVLA